MLKPTYWNHNVAYYPWIKQKISNCISILDIGCGDGTLMAYFDDGHKQLTGIDNDPFCI